MPVKHGTARFFARAQSSINALTDLVVASLTATGLVSSATLSVSGLAAVDSLTVGGLTVLPYTVTGTVAAPISGAQSPDIGDFLPYDPTGGAGVVTLPAISAANKGQGITVKNVTDDLGVVTYNTTGGNTMDGLASGAFTSSGKRHLQTFVSDGDDEWMCSPGAP